MTPRRLVILKALVFGSCLVPLALLVMKAAGIASLSFGANPVEDVLNTCGKTALNLLMLTLCVTPIRRATGFNRLIAFRRMLGLFAFFYVVLHFLTYALLDLGLAWDTLLVDIAERPFITVGFTALVLLVPLAVTSTNGFQRRLGRNWVKLHRLVYPISVLALIHYWWQIKSKADIGDPLLYAFLLTVLLGVRFAHWRKVQRQRAESVNSKAAVAPTYQRVEPP
jgi:methionine sulfoxide reductase heme-binding subunit